MWVWFCFGLFVLLCVLLCCCFVVVLCVVSCFVLFCAVLFRVCVLLCFVSFCWSVFECAVFLFVLRLTPNKLNLIARGDAIHILHPSTEDGDMDG